MEDFKEHFCKGVKEWMPLCFECKYPKEKRVSLLVEEIKEARMSNTKNKKISENSLVLLNAMTKELNFYKGALENAIKDINWSKKQTKAIDIAIKQLIKVTTYNETITQKTCKENKT